MNKGWLSLTIGIVVSILFLFNNCGEVQFSQTEQSSQGVEDPEDSETLPTDEDIQQVIDDLPAGELENPRPIQDLIDDPELAELYRCDDGGILICHFPENIDSRKSSCVGEPSVPTHVDHIRTYLDGDVEVTVFDYLGPCRDL